MCNAQVKQFAAAKVPPAPRVPTAEELDLILNAILESDRNGDCCGRADREATYDMLSAARVCIFDRYMTDGPGYFGRVAVIVWAGGPELVASVTLDGKKPQMVMESLG